MQKSRVLTADYTEVKKAPLGRYYVNVLPVVDGDYIESVCELLDHYPTNEDKQSIVARWIERRKRELTTAVSFRDSSPEVNGFLMNGEHAWLDKATRVGLMNSLSVEKSAGILETSLFLNGVAFSLPVDTAISMLSQLELYAKSCYNQTERHKMNIAACETIEEVESYDITTGYPDQLSFTL